MEYVLQETNAREVVLQALQEFGITEPSRYWDYLTIYRLQLFSIIVLINAAIDFI